MDYAVRPTVNPRIQYDPRAQLGRWLATGSNGIKKQMSLTDLSRENPALHYQVEVNNGARGGEIT